MGNAPNNESYFFHNCKKITFVHIRSIQTAVLYKSIAVLLFYSEQLDTTQSVLVYVFKRTGTPWLKGKRYAYGLGAGNDGIIVASSQFIEILLS